MNGVALGFATIGMVGVVYSAWTLLAARQQTTWSAIPGKMVRSKVEWQGEDYCPRVEYTYIVAGREYTGRSVSSPQITFNWRGPAERTCERYPEGSTVTVYVDPKNPHRSVLEPPNLGAAMILGLCFGLFLLFAFAIR